MALGLQFGRVTNILLMKTKSQAFLELSDIECSKTMINYYHYCPATVRNTPIHLQFSQHQELHTNNIKCEDLFILFGHYGDVQRVKILYNKKDTSLIQFADASQSSTALQNLNNMTLYGQEMRVSRSKHDTVNMPKSEDEGKELTKDYTNSPLHRFKKPGSKNFQNIFPPIRTLHLSNIPESVTEEEIQEMFKEHGTISNFQFFPKDRRMALIQLGTVEESIICLIKLHN